MNLKKMFSTVTFSFVIIAASIIFVQPITCSAATYEQGDINRDGYINDNDTSLLKNFLIKKANLSDTLQFKLADVNSDNTVNVADLVKLVQLTTKHDLNSDGLTNKDDVTLLKKYLLGDEAFNISTFKKADINSDNIVDIRDLVYLQQIVVRSTKGDLNQDGYVNKSDLSILKSYILKSITLTNKQLALSDMKSDNIVDLSDLSYLSLAIQ